MITQLLELIKGIEVWLLSAPFWQVIVIVLFGLIVLIGINILLYNIWDEISILFVFNLLPIAFFTIVLFIIHQWIPQPVFTYHTLVSVAFGIIAGIIYRYTSFETIGGLAVMLATFLVTFYLGLAIVNLVLPLPAVEVWFHSAPSWKGIGAIFVGWILVALNIFLFANLSSTDADTGNEMSNISYWSKLDGEYIRGATKRETGEWQPLGIIGKIVVFLVGNAIIIWLSFYLPDSWDIEWKVLTYTGLLAFIITGNMNRS